MAGRSTDTWGDPAVTVEYATSGPIDDGEKAALDHVAPDLPNTRLLDIGIGGGRTSEMLAPRVRSYRGIDISPGMLELARSRFPDLDLRLGDASALTAFDDGSADLVLFSLNGLDCLDHSGRQRALDEFARVLVPGGRVIVSTFSLDGPSYGIKPGRHRPWRRDIGVVNGVKRWFKHLTTPRATLAAEWSAYDAVADGITEGDGWATAPAPAHGFRFLLHFATMEWVRASFRDAGFEIEAAWDPSGERIDMNQKHVTTDYFYVLARRG